MNGKQTKKLIWETNTPPPTNYIWVKPNGKPYEFNNNTKKWEESNCFGGISENMSEEEQMEVRKNLGLYYEETTAEEKIAQYSSMSEYSGDQNFNRKISNDAPSKDDYLKVVITNTGEDISDVQIIDIESGYILSQSGLMPIFKIITEDTDTLTKGIYCNTTGQLFTLVYKGETTTISKIDAKFLPEQEDALPWLDITELPGTDEDYVDLSTYISQSDWNDLLDGKYIGIHVLPQQITNIENYFTILSITKAQSFVHPCVILGNFSVTGFNIDDLNNRILYLIGSNVTSISVRHVTLISSIPEPLILTALPETSITTQIELDAIGLTAANVQKLVNGGASILCLENSGGFVATRLNLEVVEFLAVNSFDLRFTDKTHRYSVSNSFGTITVTKTSLS